MWETFDIRSFEKVSVFNVVSRLSLKKIMFYESLLTIPKITVTIK